MQNSEIKNGQTVEQFTLAALEDAKAGRGMSADEVERRASQTLEADSATQQLLRTVIGYVEEKYDLTPKQKQIGGLTEKELRDSRIGAAKWAAKQNAEKKVVNDTPPSWNPKR